jgi:putative nucleotidyltransferase with HDIG domain
MSRFQDRLDRVWPRRGIMATEAGRRVVTDVVILTALAFAVSAVVVAAVVALLISLHTLPLQDAGFIAVGMGGGLVGLIGAFFVLPVFGRLSRLGDDVQLLELSDPGAPLLREMMERAPGTYSHSIMAGQLAEAAAQEVGANALLARVGAYYHDVGKIMRPQFFVENQLGMRNPHDDAPPVQSAFIITAHVREGVALAEQARLPRPVIDMIGQHHGTSLVWYFYRKAVYADANVDQAKFRYDGRRPQSVEAALVMLADASEAVVRTLADSGPAQIEESVDRIVRSRIEDGQLAESGMTDEQIEVTCRVYAKMLAGLHHPRVEYPDAPGSRS